MSKIAYILNTGERVLYHPMPYAERDILKRKAKGIEEQIKKYTKKLKDSELTEYWMKDENILKYREILKDVWNFKNDIFVQSEIHVCDGSGCLSEDFKHYGYFYKRGTGYIFYNDYCDKCYEKHIGFYGDIIELVEDK